MPDDRALSRRPREGHNSHVWRCRRGRASVVGEEGGCGRVLLLRDNQARPLQVGSELDFGGHLPGEDRGLLDHPGFLAGEGGAAAEVVPAQHDLVRADTQGWLVLQGRARYRADRVQVPGAGRIERIRHRQKDLAAECGGHECQGRREPPSGAGVVLHPGIRDHVGCRVDPIEHVEIDLRLGRRRELRRAVFRPDRSAAVDHFEQVVGTHGQLGVGWFDGLIGRAKPLHLLLAAGQGKGRLQRQCGGCLGRCGAGPGNRLASDVPDPIRSRRRRGGVRAAASWKQRKASRLWRLTRVREGCGHAGPDRRSPSYLPARGTASGAWALPNGERWREKREKQGAGGGTRPLFQARATISQAQVRRSPSPPKRKLSGPRQPVKQPPRASPTAWDSASG